MNIDGKKIAEAILDDVRTRVSRYGKPLRLAGVLIGDGDQGSRMFLDLKAKAAARVGIDFRLYEFPTTITTQQLRKRLVEIAKADLNSAIVVQLPLPEHINTQYILNAIPVSKDPDVLSQQAQGAFVAGRSDVLPPSVAAVREICNGYGIELKGKHCVVFGYGFLVGKPISQWLAMQGATVAIINEYTKQPELLASQADILISGVGKASLIQANMVKDGAIAIDFGYNKNTNGSVVGDVDFESVSQKASLITPVPGGVGPIVIAMLLQNIMTLVKSST